MSTTKKSTSPYHDVTRSVSRDRLQREASLNNYLLISQILKVLIKEGINQVFELILLIKCFLPTL